MAYTIVLQNIKRPDDMITLNVYWNSPRTLAASIKLVSKEAPKHSGICRLRGPLSSYVNTWEMMGYKVKELIGTPTD